jgi:hypothetical protein
MRTAKDRPTPLLAVFLPPTAARTELVAALRAETRPELCSKMPPAVSDLGNSQSHRECLGHVLNSREGQTLQFIQIQSVGSHRKLSPSLTT